jgi:hypothetical protein
MFLSHGKTSYVPTSVSLRICTPRGKRSLEAEETLTEGLITMIDWNSDNWGGDVHYAQNGSWVSDRPGDEERPR